jgi:hypothetical protein
LVSTAAKYEGYPLGSWVKGQREAKVEGRLAPERVRRLDDLGFVWDVNSFSWEQGFASLKAYKEEHGDCLVVKGFKYDGYPLGGWIGSQREAKVEGRLAPERVRRLDDLGFVWSLYKKK